MSERESYLSELATKRTIQIQDYPFYEHPLDVPPDGVSALRSLCANADNFRTWTDAKLCGPFHPDFAMQWIKADSTVSFLISFGCYEMQIDSPRGRLLVDLHDHKSFIRALKPFRRERPVAAYDVLLGPPPK